MSIIVVKSLTSFEYYGPFETRAKASAWAFNRYGPAAPVSGWKWRVSDLKEPRR